LRGINGTIFAYGQTGTGKTYTITGPSEQEFEGLIPRSIRWIFNSIQNRSDHKIKVRTSYIEVYKEKVRDLLNNELKNNQVNIKVKDNIFYLDNCIELKVESADQMFQAYQMGLQNRMVAQTLMSQVCNRSHSIFIIIIESSNLDSLGNIQLLENRLLFVDLAGSERLSKTGTLEERYTDLIKTNISLTYLQDIIYRLSNGKNQPISYRDSKLTMLLKDSLGGNTKTLMFATISPSDYNYDETLSTLRFASNAKKIQNKLEVIVNEPVFGKNQKEKIKEHLFLLVNEESEIYEKKTVDHGEEKEKLDYIPK
jgi:hypothetical protein